MGLIATARNQFVVSVVVFSLHVAGYLKFETFMFDWRDLDLVVAVLVEIGGSSCCPLKIYQGLVNLIVLSLLASLLVKFWEVGFLSIRPDIDGNSIAGAVGN
ncbi:hypothetical protein Tsubulata_003440 [Turnera subulata]|uniref:Uncharacterized protein n=1 Tax=Turnera subulata TaxID=218843 RepID=A0A9Q0FXI2_9ROSI|nr:hypothetical protein Tsubulata_003440 [Turnera subulata]